VKRELKVSVLALGALIALAVTISALPAGAAAEQASQPSLAATGGLDAGRFHSCALLPGGSLRCWGYGLDGALGYGNTATIGDDETPAAAGPVDLGPGRTAKAVSAGDVHTCAQQDDDAVRCWGFGGDGRLGYGNVASVGRSEAPGTVGPVDLGAGRTARAITAGRAHTCAVLDGGDVRCWGFGFDGRLGYGTNRPEDQNNIGDDETPGSIDPVNLGPRRTATAITAGDAHTCAVLDDGNVRCWGFAGNGQLGYGNTDNIGDNETPDTAGPGNPGPGRTAKAITAGNFHTCAVLDDGNVRCWGFGGNGRLGYGNTDSIGDNETPDTAGPVNLGPGRTAKAITAGADHTCAVLDNDSVRCWGFGRNGALGYANTATIGDDESPGSVGPVDLGPGRTTVAISAGGRHTCARLDDGSVRCWGDGANGELGYCARHVIGDDETPGSVGPVDLGVPGARGAGCAPPPSPPPPSPPPPAPPPPATPPPPAPEPPPASPSPPLAPAPSLALPQVIFPAKVEVERARVLRSDRRLDVLAPITGRASGAVDVEFFAARERLEFSEDIDAQNRRVRFNRQIPADQARLGTGIMTVTYGGDVDTRPQEVRLRAASQRANLELDRPVIEDGRLKADGTISGRARGIVRLQLQYVVDGETQTIELRGEIDDGRWEIDEALSQETRDEIARRTGTVHSYTLFTGFFERRIRGEMQSFQVLGDR
jgi:alpha-tubulin suppressor-like RCC1 family protein